MKCRSGKCLSARLSLMFSTSSGRRILPIGLGGREEAFGREVHRLPSLISSLGGLVISFALGELGSERRRAARPHCEQEAPSFLSRPLFRKQVWRKGTRPEFGKPRAQGVISYGYESPSATTGERSDFRHGQHRTCLFVYFLWGRGQYRGRSCLNSGLLG